MNNFKELSCSPLNKNSRFPSFLGIPPSFNLFNFPSVPFLDNSNFVKHHLQLPDPDAFFIIPTFEPSLDPGSSGVLHSFE